VSAETVQKAFGTKAAFFKETYDVTLAGDDEPVPMLERPVAGVTGFLGHLAETGCLPRDLPIEHARDIVSALASPEMYDLLITGRGWTPEQYEHWLAQALADALNLR